MRLAVFAGLTLGLIAMAANGQLAQRPREITLILNFPRTLRFDDGRVFDQKAQYRVYFSGDGTTFINTRSEGGVVIPPNASSGRQEHQDSDGDTVLNSASIAGSANALNLTLWYDGGKFHSSYAMTILLTGNGCALSNYNGWARTDPGAVNPLVSVSFGTPTCEAQKGRQLFGPGG
jgi:hypothetical protein